MIDDRVDELVQLLIESSKAGSVNWVTARAAGVGHNIEDDFVFNTPNATVNIFTSYTGPEPAIVLNILNSEAQVVVSKQAQPGHPDYQTLYRLFDYARFKALAVGPIIDELATALKSSTPRTEPKPAKDEDVPF